MQLKSHFCPLQRGILLGGSRLLVHSTRAQMSEMSHWTVLELGRFIFNNSKFMQYYLFLMMCIFWDKRKRFSGSLIRLLKHLIIEKLKWISNQVWEKSIDKLSRVSDNLTSICDLILFFSRTRMRFLPLTIILYT